jgi:hypothetical protein
MVVEAEDVNDRNIVRQICRAWLLSLLKIKKKELKVIQAERW